MDVLVFLVALAAVGVMGFANQRGGTCTVAAIEEVIGSGGFSRLLAVFEASLWVGCGLVVLQALGALPAMPPGYAPRLLTIVGGVLFGLGAVVNGACLFGTVARFGSGEWAYASTPVGLFVGSLATAGVRAADRLPHPSVVLAASAFSLMAAAGLLLARLASHGFAIRRRKRAILEHIWSPHVATTVIGVTFLVAFVTAGHWDYADFLTELAHGQTQGWLGKTLLAAALIAGAVVGGWTAGRLRLVRPTRRELLKRFVGGTLMGAGASLIPGGNTGLILLGMPMLWPYAWLGFLTICLTIYVCLRVNSAVAARLSRPAT